MNALENKIPRLAGRGLCGFAMVGLAQLAWIFPAHASKLDTECRDVFAFARPKVTSPRTIGVEPAPGMDMYGRKVAEVGQIVYVGTNRVMSLGTVGRVASVTPNAHSVWGDAISVELLDGKTSTQWRIASTVLTEDEIAAFKGYYGERIRAPWFAGSGHASDRRKILDTRFAVYDGPTPGARKRVKVAFFDADGTLRTSVTGEPYIHFPEEVVLLPHTIERVKELNEQGYLVAIVSNQKGIPEFATFENVDLGIQRTMSLLGEGGAIVHFYDFAESDDEYRKLGTGMARNLRAALRARGLDIDWAQSFMVGDAAYQVGESRPDGTPGTDFTNTDRLFAENLKIRFREAREFFGWR